MSQIIRSFLGKMEKENFKKEDLSEDEWIALKSALNEIYEGKVDIDTNGGLPVKTHMIESMSTEGYCYLRMFATLPNLRDCKMMDLERSLISMKAVLKENPYGKDLLVELAIANHTLKFGTTMGFDVEEFESDHKNQTGFIKSVMNSKCVIGMEERNGVKHLSSVTLEDCGCNTIICEHGYASRLIYCIMIQEGVRFGGTGETIINLDDLFSDFEPIENEPITPNMTPTDENTSFNFPRFDRNVELQSVIDDRNSTIEKLHQRLRIEIAEKKNRERGNLNKEKDDLNPDDSSSQINRYNSGKKYMSPGTVYSVNPQGKTVLTVIDETPTVLNTTNVIQGFVKTPEITRLENRSIKKIAPINGLAQPFRNHRLNLLCHFNTALGSFKGAKDNNVSLFDSMRALMKYSAVTPSEELAYQIIVRTFDLERKTIVANPFRLPFIEVGMSMSDASLNKCFDLLNMEYEMLWFSELKSLKVPSFHNLFDKYKENRLTTSFRGKGGGSKVRETSNSRRTSSMLGF